MHRSVAAVPGSNVLELGAGTLNHLPYEPQHARYDVVEPFEALWVDSPNRNLVNRFYASIADVPAEERYEKIVSVAVLEHLTEMPDVLAKCALHLSPGGSFAAGYPNEGGFAWYAAWRFGTGVVYRLRTGLSYKPLMRHEHVNEAREIDTLIRYFFRSVSTTRFPWPWFQTALYSVTVARDPNLDACREWLSR